MALLIGVVAAFTGSVVMLLVSVTERLLKRLLKNEILRRLSAAVLLTALATRFPAVLGSGHAAIELRRGRLPGLMHAIWQELLFKTGEADERRGPRQAPDHPAD